MIRMLNGVLWLVAGLALAAAAMWLVGPRERVDTGLAFDPAVVPADVEGWLADREARVPDLREGSAKAVLWHGAPGARTSLSVVYVHGFSADPWEMRPVPDLVAERLGANLHLTRLRGHGRDGAAMAEASAGDWLEDLAEAVEVGRRLGDRVVLMGGSTGATLIAAAAADPALAALMEDVAGVALLSPNFAVSNPAARLLTWPAARAWIPVVAGPTRGFEPQNARHARHWTTEYPTVATLPMAAAVEHARGLDWARAEVPALFAFSPSDAVVRPEATERVAARWGGPVAVERVEVGPDGDPMNHVIAGDILSPGNTRPVADLVARWAGSL